MQLKNTFFIKNEVIMLNKLGDSWNYIPAILVSSSAKHIATQVSVIAKWKKKYFFFERLFVCDVIRPYKEPPVQS